MRVLIAGSSGLIGSCVFEKLRERYEVLGLDLKPSPYTTIVGDIRDYCLVEKVVGSVDVIVHCAAQTSVARSVEDPLFDAENNIIGTLNLLEAARKSKRLKRFVYISSAAVYGFPEYVPIDEDHPCRPVSPYGVSKLAGELYARVFHEIYRVPTVCIRPFNVYGRNQDPNSPYSGVISKFLDRISKGLPLVIYGDGEQTRDFIHVSDVADMIVMAMEREEALGEVFNCGTGREVSINELAKIMLSISSNDFEVEHSDGRPGDIRRSCADIRRAEKVLGFKPKISLEEGLKELLRKGQVEGMENPSSCTAS
jgi:UDP-glucose 4-epimerase